MAENFYTILTNIGKASVANATALGGKVDFQYMALGDGNGNYYNPTETQTQLVNEVYRGQINHIQLDDSNPNWVTLSAVVPAIEGGFTVREVGAFDTDNNLLAVGKYPETYKPVLAEGSSKDLTINMILEVSNASVVNLKVDPTVILASKKYVDDLAGVGRTTETVKKNADDLAEHKADIVTDAEGVHGFKIETGTFTPVLIGSAVGGVNTYSIQQGHYHKIGKNVFINIYIALSIKDTNMAGEVYISGLPFVVATGGSGNMTAFTLGLTSNIDYDGELGATSSDGYSYINLFNKKTNIYASEVNVDKIKGNTMIMLSGNYFTTL